MTHEDCMRRAIALAKQGSGFVNPNPLVGAVIVRDGRIIGEGYHMKYGTPHAERNALANCTEDPRGAERGHPDPSAPAVDLGVPVLVGAPLGRERLLPPLPGLRHHLQLLLLLLQMQATVWRRNCSTAGLHRPAVLGRSVGLRV